MAGLIENIKIMDALKQTHLPAVVYIFISENNPEFDLLIRRFAEKFKDRVAFFPHLVTDPDPILREMFVLEFPTLILFNQGREIARLAGSQPEDVVEGLYKMVLMDQKPIGLHLTPFDRLVRLMVGAAIMVLGYAEEQSWILMSLGLLVILLAFLDRFNGAYRTLVHKFKKS